MLRKNAPQILYTEEEAAKLFDLSISGFQKYRYAGHIEFIQPEKGCKVLYSHRQIEDFCERHAKRNKPKSKTKNGETLIALLIFFSNWEIFMFM